MSLPLSEVLADQQYCLLTTFKKSGEEVPCPMWFVLDGEAALMTTRGQSWKVKRIRNNPKVKIGWSNSSGQRHGELYEGEAELLDDPEERQRAIAALDKKYRWQKKLIDFGLRFSRDKTEAILKVTLKA